MSRIVRPLVAACIAAAVVFALLFTSSTPAMPLTSTATPQPPATMQVTGSDIQRVASYEDCVNAAADILTGMAGRGVKIATTAKKVAATVAGLATLIPGVKCGKYLGDHNVRLICDHTQRSWWIPGVLKARGFVWLVTGGQTNRC